MLACRSPYFSELIYNCESHDDDGGILELDCVDCHTMIILLNYIYEGSVTLSDIDIDLLLKLLKASRLMSLYQLTSAVESYIVDRIRKGVMNVDDCLETFEFSVTFKFEALKDCALDYLSMNIDILCHEHKFSTLSFSAILAFIKFKGPLSKEIE